MNVKDRLTAHNKAGQGIINMDGVSDVLEASARIRTFSPLIISKLTEYEDTGLSPNEIERLKSENAALRERLKKAVELKVKVGDTIYMPWIWNGNSGIAGLIVREIQTVGDGVTYYITSFTTDDLAFAAHYKFGKFEEYYFGNMVFTTPEAATIRLEELKGKRND